MKKIGKILLSSSAVFLLAACGDLEMEERDLPDEDTELVDPTEETEDAAEMDEVEPVTVNLLSNEGDEVGTAVFSEENGEVMLELDLEGIPAGEYGMHIHEVGQATPPTFEDAGSHFNPTDVEHGTESETGPHVGDLPNLIVPEDGTVQETIAIPNTSLHPDGENTLDSEQGTSLIIHTDKDDYESQPTGDAGDRMIGGVIFPGSAE